MPILSLHALVLLLGLSEISLSKTRSDFYEVVDVAGEVYYRHPLGLTWYSLSPLSRLYEGDLIKVEDEGRVTFMLPSSLQESLKIKTFTVDYPFVFRLDRQLIRTINITQYEVDKIPDKQADGDKENMLVDAWNWVAITTKNSWKSLSEKGYVTFTISGSREPDDFGSSNRKSPSITIFRPYLGELMNVSSSKDAIDIYWQTKPNENEGEYEVFVWGMENGISIPSKASARVRGDHLKFRAKRSGRYYVFVRNTKTGEVSRVREFKVAFKPIDKDSSQTPNNSSAERIVRSVWPVPGSIFYTSKNKLEVPIKVTFRDYFNDKLISCAIKGPRSTIITQRPTHHCSGILESALGTHDWQFYANWEGHSMGLNNQRLWYRVERPGEKLWEPWANLETPAIFYGAGHE